MHSQLNARWLKRYRILKRKEILSLRQGSENATTRSLLVVVKQNNMEQNRFAITVSKKVDKRAVSRNRLKRYIREVLRFTGQTLSPTVDVHVIARIGASERNFHDIEREMLQAFRRLRILPRS